MDSGCCGCYSSLSIAAAASSDLEFVSSKPCNLAFSLRSTGWAAFDRRQQDEHVTVPGSVDPFPSITKLASSRATKPIMTNHCTPTRTFSSVVRPSLEFPVLVGKCKAVTISSSPGETLRDKQRTSETNPDPVKMLKDIHSWAEQSLIEDILAATNSDVDQASVLLKAMVSPDAEITETTLSDTSSSTASYPCDSKNKCPGKSNLIKQTTLSGASSSNMSYTCDSKNNCSGASGLVENKLDDAHEVLISRQLFSVPVEPEWEEEDIYLSHRKDAIKMMRIASQHSRSASNAFLKGDHVSARHHSLRAQEEWMAAEKLNAKAAEEILHIRNMNNGIWKLDLHGLHATEAVNALKEHLHRIESQTLIKHSASSDELTKLGSGILRSSSLESLSCLDVETRSKEKKVLPQQRQTVLHVITGNGNHSREPASLHMAVRSFLIENRYRFEEARPGAIDVRPKFRHK